MKANTLSPYNSEPHRSSENSYSPIAPGTLKAQESSIFSSCSVPGTDTFSGGLEKILLERLLLRKELKIRSMQSKLDSLGIDFQQCKEEKEKEIENLKRKLEEKEIVSNYFKSEYRNLERTPLLPTILLVLSVLSYTRSYIQRITATLLQMKTHEQKEQAKPKKKKKYFHR